MNEPAKHDHRTLWAAINRLRVALACVRRRRRRCWVEYDGREWWLLTGQETF